MLAVQRVAGNQLGIKNRKFKKYQLVAAATDPKIIILFISVFAAAIPNGVVRYVNVLPRASIEGADASPQQLLFGHHVRVHLNVLLRKLIIRHNDLISKDMGFSSESGTLVDTMKLILFFSATKTTVLKSVGDIVQVVALLIGGIVTLNFPNCVFYPPPPLDQSR